MVFRKNANTDHIIAVYCLATFNSFLVFYFKVQLKWTSQNYANDRMVEDIWNSRNPGFILLFCKVPNSNFKIDPETGVPIRIYVAGRKIKSTIHILK